MNFLLFSLSLITFNLGIIFERKPKKILKFLYFFYLLFFSLSLYSFYSASLEVFKINIFFWLASRTYHLGSFLYGCTMIIKRHSIVNFVVFNIHLLSKLQSNLIILYVLLIFSVYVFDWVRGIEIIFLGIKRIVLKEEQLNTESVSYLIIFFLHTLYSSWIPFSSTIYGLMYFLMHIKHMQLLDILSQTKSNSYSTFFKTLTVFQLDYEHFNNLVSTFPAVWLIHVLLSMSTFVKLVKILHSIDFYNLLLKEFVSWPLIFILIAFCRSRLTRKIIYLQLIVSYDNTTNGPQTSAMMNVLKRICKCHVTAGNFVNIDRSLILPYVGSVCTYTFLFLDRFTTEQILTSIRHY